jgi:hypothetical protein
MEIAKFIFSLALAIGSLFIFWYIRGKSWEMSLYRNSVIYGTLLKFCLCLLIYSLWPSLNRGSDAALWYFPDTLRLLSGEVPYRDFKSSYSILFHPLLSLPVFLWRSLGSVVLSMLLIEVCMIFVYLYRCHKKNWGGGWAVAFLYCFSPISFYWAALTGYNGVIIAFFILLGVVFVENGIFVCAIIFTALSFLCCKLLAILSWPGIVFYNYSSRTKMILPLAILLILVTIFPLIGIDTLLPIKSEFFRTSSGNLWYLVSTAFPGLKKSLAWQALPVLSFAAIFVILFILFLRENVTDTEYRFDRAVAFIATTNLLFMILSKKSYTFYMLMTLIFIIHTIVRNNQYAISRIMPLAFLGATTTIEPYLYQKNQSTGQMIWLLFMLDTIIVGCYIYWTVLCFLISSPSLKLNVSHAMHRRRLP